MNKQNLTKDDYLKKEKQFYELLTSALQTDILLYCVTGSLARNEIIPGWSDIDVLLVIKDYTPSLMEKISDVLYTTEGEIKIGTSIFSLEEFNHKYFKDSKTYISTSLLKQGYYKPRIIDPCIVLQAQDESLRKYMNIYDFARFNHDLKRELLRNPEEYDEKKVYKLAIILLKIALFEKNVVTFGYPETLQKATEVLEGFAERLVAPDIIMNTPENKAKRYNDYVHMFEWIRKNINAVFQ